MVRKRIASFLLLSGLLFVTGCSNLSILDSRSKPLEEQNNTTEIIIWHTYNEEETKVFEDVLIPLFEEEHPTIIVKPVRQPHNDQLKSALISRASANKPPDIIRMDIAWLPSFAELDLIYPVSQFSDFAELKSLFYDVPLQSNYYVDAYYGVPLNTNTKVAIYNRELLENAGYQAPPTTIDGLLTLVKDHDYIIGIGGVSAWESLAYFYAFGGELLDENYQQATGYLDSEESVQAVNILLQMYEEGHLPNGFITGNPLTWEGVLDGRYAVIDEGHWFYSIRQKEVMKELYEKTVLAPFPATKGRGSVLGGENLVITKGTKHLEESWTFLKWMTTETPQRMLLETGLIPTNKHVEVADLYDDHPYLQTYVESLDDAFLRPPLAEWSKIDEIYTRYMRLIFSKNMSVEEGLHAAAQEIDTFLTQSN
ncbi:extracellular solute-binding protein [Sutcliffiella rhizosphaerae]|uniref:Extracellular solute-binding protein n=1 Tax=Sutcliffiella rhizosphaerae TaxID=2880967 RepID=A0ABN8A5F6_9BACI|nr:extracellular solute-binding protein [Sutcliffiella rhizosphaerae]CAG9620338.1 hypothetical protein BACCIP111883_01106 [Sutcliffiella rhizosphaerae]